MSPVFPTSSAAATGSVHWPARGRCLLLLPRLPRRMAPERRQGSRSHEARMRLRTYRTHFLRQWKPELPAEQTNERAGIVSE